MKYAQIIKNILISIDKSINILNKKHMFYPIFD